MFLKRLGPDPHADGVLTPALHGCPDIFELIDGDFAIIGIDMTATGIPHLRPAGQKSGNRNHPEYEPAKL